ncbi:hypothetical protein EDB19DRAFT_1904109 [Suillus lakei]|nr:hypothetical protein EDB19DRAFT_1904109 [Suillus lakei]
MSQRKFDDALQSLDSAVAPAKPLPERPTAPKRPHMTRSLYSTLAKYGIQSNVPKPPIDTPDKHDISKTAPHLAAIVARSKSKGAIPFAHPSSLLSRMATYKLATYANKPPQIDAVAAAKCRWINDGRDRLVCGICDVSWVVAGRDGMTREAANDLVEKQRIHVMASFFFDVHLGTLLIHSLALIYCVPLQAPASMAWYIKSHARTLERLVTNVVIKHPLPAQAQPESENELAMQVDADPEPSDTAIVTLRLVIGPTCSSLGTQSRFVSFSVARTVLWGRGDSPFPRPFPPPTGISQLGGTPRPGRVSSTLFLVLTTRRPLGKSTPSPQDGSPPPHPTTKKRQFDVLNEHRSYRPYVVPSTVVPMLPMPPTSPVSVNALADGAIEGWRAVLTVVLRHGLTERQRNIRLSHSGGDNEATHGIDDELEGVEAMVAGVKSKGGRDVLKYVKGLLG